jgi:hypothetical protein
MNVHKRHKKPSFLKVFERRHEKEDNPLLQAAMSSTSTFHSTVSTDDEVGLPAMISSSQHSGRVSQSTADVDGNENGDGEALEQFITEYCMDDDSDGSDVVSESSASEIQSKDKPEEPPGTPTTIGSSLPDELPAEITDCRSALTSETTVSPTRKRTDHTSETTSAEGLMDSHIFSEHSENSTMNDDDINMVIDNSVHVPDDLVKHANAAALATSVKVKDNRRSSRLLSGAKGLLRGAKPAIAQPTHRVELQAAVRKVSAGESAKSFAQFSLEEVVAGDHGAVPVESGLLMDGDDLYNIDSDDDDSEDEWNQGQPSDDVERVDLSASVEDPPCQQSVFRQEVWAYEDKDFEREEVETERDLIQGMTSPEIVDECTSASENMDDNDLKIKHRNPASKTTRQSTGKEVAGSQRRERQRSRAGDKAHVNDRLARNSKATSHDTNEYTTNRPSEKPAIKTHHHERKKRDSKPRKEHIERSSGDHIPPVMLVDENDRDSSVNPATAANNETNKGFDLNVGMLPPVIRSPIDESIPKAAITKDRRNAAQADPGTPLAVSVARVGDHHRRDRASKTTESPPKRRSAFAKSLSDRLIPPMSPAAVVDGAASRVNHKKKTDSGGEVNQLPAVQLLPPRLEGIASSYDVQQSEPDKVAEVDERTVPSSRPHARSTDHDSEPKSAQPESQTIPLPPHEYTLTVSHPTDVNLIEITDYDGEAVVTESSVEATSAQIQPEGTHVIPSLEERKAVVEEVSGTDSPASASRANTVQELEATRSSCGAADTSSATATLETNAQQLVISISSGVNMDQGASDNHTLIRNHKHSSNNRTAARSHKSRGVDSSRSKRKSSPRALRSSRREPGPLSNLAVGADVATLNLTPSREKSKIPPIKPSVQSPRSLRDQGVVFTWQRNPPARAARRLSRTIGSRQGSSRALEDGLPISTALARALLSVPDTLASASPKSDALQLENKLHAVLSEELHEENNRLSNELRESRARVILADAAVLHLAQQLSLLQKRLDQVELRKGG